MAFRNAFRDSERSLVTFLPLTTPLGPNYMVTLPTCPRRVMLVSQCTHG